MKKVVPTLTKSKLNSDTDLKNNESTLYIRVLKERKKDSGMFVYKEPNLK